jgi:hypothetical protein
MRFAGLALAVVFIALIPTILSADDLTGSQRFLCAGSQATACSTDGNCQKGLPGSWNMPQFVEVDLTQKRLSTTKASGEDRSTSIANLVREDGKIVLQGCENGRAFSFVIDEKTGDATVSVAMEDLSLTAFAACTPLTDAR